MPKSQKTLNITEPEIGDAGIEYSNANNVQRGGGNPASAAELAIALEASQKQVDRLERELQRQSSGSNQINDLVQALANLIPKQPVQQNVPNPENVNRTADFQTQRATVDGRSVMEAQQTLMEFRNEEKYPISISKSLSAYVGANLDISVNGARVSIPCDGKTYYINKSHWEHARERLAKLDLLNSNTEPQIVVMGD